MGSSSPFFWARNTGSGWRECKCQKSWLCATRLYDRQYEWTMKNNQQHHCKHPITYSNYRMWCKCSSVLKGYKLTIKYYNNKIRSYYSVVSVIDICNTRVRLCNLGTGMLGHLFLTYNWSIYDLQIKMHRAATKWPHYFKPKTNRTLLKKKGDAVN